MGVATVLILIVWVIMETCIKVKEGGDLYEEYIAGIKKTNSILEQRTLDTFMKHGYSFDESFKKTQAAMKEKGFEPCIPKEAYYHSVDRGIESSVCRDVTRYDTLVVRHRRGIVEREWRKKHDYISMPISEYDIIYNNFPTTIGEYKRETRTTSVTIEDFKNKK